MRPGRKGEIKEGEVLPGPTKYDSVNEDLDDAELKKSKPGNAAYNAIHRFPRVQRFLAAYAETGIVRNACELAQIPRRTVYQWLLDDKEFADAFARARDVATDRLEEEARRRGMMGTQEPVYYQGKVVGHMTKYSDILLLAMLNAYRPEKFKNRQEVTGKDGGPIAVVHVSYDHNMKPDDMP